MKLTGIYCIRHISSGKCYVGQSVDIQKRIKEHFEYQVGFYLGNAIRKYGREAFVFEYLELCSEENLDSRECHWIAVLDCMHPNGYNLRSGGARGRHSELSKQKISKGKIGKKRPPPTEQARRNLSAASLGKKNHFYGKRHTAESKQKMSESTKRSWREKKRNPLQLTLFD